MNNIIDQLHTHSNEAIEKGLYEVIDENVSLIKDLYRILLLEETSSDIVQKVADHIEHVIGDLFIKYFDKEMINEAVKLLISFYENQSEVKRFVYLEVELRHLFKYIEGADYISERFFSSIETLFQILYKSAGLNDIGQINYISQIYTTLYSVIYKNPDLKGYNKENSLKKLVDHVAFLKNTSMPEITRVVKLRMLKTMIDSRDVKNFKQIVKWSFLSEEGENYKFEIILTLSLYLYYLIYKERLVEGEKYREFLDIEIFKNLQEFIIQNDKNLSTVLDNISRELDSWEKMPEEEAKWMIMKGVIREFMFFISCSVQSDFLKDYDQGEISSLLLMIDSEPEELLINRYESFKQDFMFFTYNESYKEIKNAINLLKKQYIKLELVKLSNINESLHQIVINDFININEVEENLILKRFLRSENTKTVEKSFTKLIPTIGFQTHNINTIVKGLREILIRNLNYDTIKVLTTSKMKVIITDKERKDKIKLLLNGYQNNNDAVNPMDLVITNFEVDSYFLYYENFDDKKVYQEKLLEYEVHLDKSFFNNFYWLITNSRKITYNLKDLKVNIRNLNELEMGFLLKKYIVSDNLFSLSIINEIKMDFDKEEAMKYLNLNYKVVEITIEVGFNVEKAGGQIVYFR